MHLVGGIIFLVLQSQSKTLFFGGVAQPFTGAIADKYGTKKVVAIGGLSYAIGLILMAFSSTSLLLNLSLGLIIGLALSATSFTILLSAVGRAAPPEKRVVWRWELRVQQAHLGNLSCCHLPCFYLKASGGLPHC